MANITLTEYRYVHQGVSHTFKRVTSKANIMQTFKSNGNEYHNLQVQLNKQAQSANLKRLSRKNSTCPSAACILVASAWNSVEGVLRAALEQSNDLGSGDGKYCRKICIHKEYALHQRPLRRMY